MLVGRKAEQRAIDRLVEGARLGTSGVLAVTGEAGAGKSALLEHAASASEGVRILRGSGYESEREIPFAMLLQLLRPALDSLDDIPPVQADALAAALALPRASAPRDAVDRFTIGAAVLSLICRYAEEIPVAVVVDDLHVADAPSANALLFAARRLSADPVLVLLAARSPEGDALVAGLPILALAGLDLDDARELLARTPDGSLPDERVRLLHRATDGNPLALLELRGAERDVVEGVEAGLPVRVPRALAEAFGRRLAQLDDECRSVLLTAAVCGTDRSLIARTCAALGLDAGRLDEASDLGLIAVRGPRVEFRHPLLRAAAYSGASASERRAAHRAAADSTPTGDVDRRAWHLSEAVWHPDAAVAALLAEAGDLAIARGAHSIASAAFERSARLSPDAGDRAARLLRAADAAWSAGDGGRALALLNEREAEARGGRDIREIELRASIAARGGSVREARDFLLLAADQADRPDDVAISLADAVHAGFYLGDAHTASSIADRLSELQPSLTEPRARALGLMATGMARVLAGRGGVDEIRAAVPLLESDPDLRHDPRRLSWLLLAPLFLRDATSGARLRALVDEVRGQAGVGALPSVLFHVARDEATSGASWARAEADYAESIRLARETGQATELAMSLAGLCWLDSRAGRADDCLAHGTEARELCISRDIHIGEVWVGLARGDLALSLGDAPGAAHELSELAELLERLGIDDVDLSPAPELADALVRLGERERARDLAAEHRRRATDKGQPWALARADRAIAIAAADDRFESDFESALARHEQTLDAFEAARTRLAYGERLRRQGRRVDARVQLRTALDTFAELGARVWTERAATELTATGEHVRTPGANPIESLTPQELQVCVLLTEGRTTRETAAALFLSPKTVEYHLRKVYTKLGIGSRSELADLLAVPEPESPPRSHE